MINTKKTINGALFIAFGVILPTAFHYLGLPGGVFLPMHIPVLLAGLLLGGKIGLIVGMLTPLLSSFLTGMPPIMPTLPRMVIELGVYGLAGGYFYRNKKNSLFAALIISMILGRIASLVSFYILVLIMGLEIKPLTYLGIYTWYSVPGIIVQLLLIPFIIKKLEKHNLVKKVQE